MDRMKFKLVKCSKDLVLLNEFRIVDFSLFRLANLFDTTDCILFSNINMGMVSDALKHFMQCFGFSISVSFFVELGHILGFLLL